MLSLLEYSIPLDAPSSVPLPSIDAFLSSYRDIEFVKESTTGKMESMEVHSIDQAIPTPTVPHNTIISGVLRSSLNGGWIIDVLHIFIQEPFSGFQAPSVAFCPREYVYDTSKFSIKHNLLPGVFVKGAKYFIGYIYSQLLQNAMNSCIGDVHSILNGLLQNLR